MLHLTQPSLSPSFLSPVIFPFRRPPAQLLFWLDISLYFPLLSSPVCSLLCPTHSFLLTNPISTRLLFLSPYSLYTPSSLHPIIHPLLHLHSLLSFTVYFPLLSSPGCSLLQPYSSFLNLTFPSLFATFVARNILVNLKTPVKMSVSDYIRIKHLN